MRRLLVLLLLTSAASMVAAPAHAGTYTVSSCSPPGGAAGSDGAAWSAVAERDPGAFRLKGDCSGLGLQVDTGAPGQAFSTAFLRLRAPAGATIADAKLYRYMRSYAPDSNGWLTQLQIVSPGGAGTVPPYRGSVFADSCTPSDTGFCERGPQGGAANDLFEPDVASGPAEVRYAIACTKPSCPATNPEGVPFALARIGSALVTIREDGAPAPALAGPLTSGAWQRPEAGLTVAATDPTGVRQTRVLVDGNPVQTLPGACRPDRTVPCPDLPATAVDPALLPSGAHTVTVEATDGAGNVASQPATVRVDRDAPVVTFHPLTSRTVRATAADADSGLASGTIAAARGARGEFRPLKTSRSGGDLRARLPFRASRAVRLRVTATDAVGNAATVDGDRALRVSAGFGDKRRRVGSVRAGRPGSLSGVVRNRAGRPLAGVAVDVRPTTLVTGARPAEAATVTTDARGRFRYRAPAGFSRRLRVTVPATAGEPGVTIDAALLVRAASSVRVAPRRVASGGRIRITGTLRRFGATVPDGGKLLDLQGFERGRWRTFASERTDGRGRWSFRYRFGSGARGTFPIRVRVRREASYPFHVGTSRSVRVSVG